MADAALDRLRATCAKLPDTTETDSWGHPNFKAGKRAFAAFEWIKGRPSIAIHLGDAESDAFLLGNPEAFVTPYGRGKWISLWADEPIDWHILEDIIVRGYRSVALRRMIVDLESRSSRERRK